MFSLRQDWSEVKRSEGKRDLYYSLSENFMIDEFTQNLQVPPKMLDKHSDAIQDGDEERNLRERNGRCCLS
jgi:hypothetical protein